MLNTDWMIKAAIDTARYECNDDIQNYLKLKAAVDNLWESTTFQTLLRLIQTNEHRGMSGPCEDVVTVRSFVSAGRIAITFESTKDPDTYITFALIERDPKGIGLHGVRGKDLESILHLISMFRALFQASHFVPDSNVRML